MNNFKIDSSDGSSDGGDKAKLKVEDVENYELYSNYVQSADVVSANVGTSNKSSNSFRNTKPSVSKMDFSVAKSDLVELDEATLLRINELKKEKERMRLNRVSINQEGGVMTDHMSQKSLNNTSQVLTTADYDLTNEDFEDNYLEHMTIIAEEPLDAYSHVNESSRDQHKLKRTVVTVLLTQKWRQDHRGAVMPRKSRKKPKQIRYHPTYRMDPKLNLNHDDHTRRQVIVKLKQTFHSLVEKHGKYDIEYTPRFLKIVTEMIKNDVKSFKMLERFKVIVFTSIFQKNGNHSAMFISRELRDTDRDTKFEISEETNTFYAVCLVFLIYAE
jgi:hypothetical protein